MIHELITDNALLAEKTGYFFDRFRYAAETMGRNDFVERDNPQTLISKIIYQVEHNDVRFRQYLNKYIEHPWLNKDEPYFEKDARFAEVQVFFQEYRNTRDRDKEKIAWMERNRASFLSALKDFQAYLKENMVEAVLASVLSFCKCPHDLAHHKAGFGRSADCLASAFLLSGRFLGDLRGIFYRLFNAEGHGFPFPLDASDDAMRNDFVKNRTFDQAMGGIARIFREPAAQGYFFVPVKGYRVPDDFMIAYNEVKFYSPRHESLRGIWENSDSLYKEIVKEILEEELLGVVQVSYRNPKEGAERAWRKVKAGLEHLNIRLDMNCHANPFISVITCDLKTLNGVTRDHRRGGLDFDSGHIELLEDNIYNALQGTSDFSKAKMLSLEVVHNRALSSRDAADYWVYLEKLLPKLNGDKQVKSLMSLLLADQADYYHKQKVLAPYIRDILFNSSSRSLGLSPEQYKNYLTVGAPLDIDGLHRDVVRPFVKDLLAEYSTPMSLFTLKSLREHYERVATDSYHYRNVDQHDSAPAENDPILNTTIIRLTTRLRWLLFAAIRKYDGQSFEEIVNRIAEDACTSLAKKTGTEPESWKRSNAKSTAVPSTNKNL